MTNNFIAISQNILIQIRPSRKTGSASRGTAGTFKPARGVTSSGIWDIPFGLGSWSNPVEQPNSAWPSEPETPEPYSSPSQQYVDDLDDFFYGYDNSDLYETAVQMAISVTITTPSSQQVTYAYSGTSNSDLELVGDPLSDSEAEALFGPNYTPTGNYDHIWDVLFDIMDSASENIMTTLSDAERAPLADAVENTLTGTSSPEEPSQTHSRTWGEFFWENIHSGLDVAGLVPGFGEFADGTNALLYLSEGNYTEAGLSAAAMVPIGGTGVTTAKWTKMVLKRLVPPQILQIPQSVERKLPVLLRMPRN